jgi:hypothetical protein
VPDTDKTARQHMQQEATQELIDVQSQESFFVLVSGVAPAERHLVLDERNEPVVGNRNTMGVGAEVTKDSIGSAERRFAIDNPSQRVKLADQTLEQLGLSHTFKQSVELELSRSVSQLESFSGSAPWLSVAASIKNSAAAQLGTYDGEAARRLPQAAH